MPIETASERQFGSSKNQMNKIMEQMQKGFFGFLPGETWTPAVNVYEHESHYAVCVDLAGVIKEEIDLQVTNNTLVLRGNRIVPVKPREEGDSTVPVTSAAPTARSKVHLMEIDHGQFVREVELPPNVEDGQISATYRNGILWIELPKKR